MKHPPLKRQLINISKTTLFFTTVFYSLSYGVVALQFLFDTHLNFSITTSFFVVISMFLSYIFSSISLSRSRAAGEVTFPYGVASFSLKTVFYVLISIETLTLNTVTFIVSTIFVFLTIFIDILMVIKSYKADEHTLRHNLLKRNALLDQNTLETYLKSYKYHKRFLIIWFIILVIGEVNTPIFLGGLYSVFLIITIILYKQAAQLLEFTKEKTMQSLFVAIGVIGIIFIIRLSEISVLNHLIVMLFLHIMVYYPILKVLYNRYDKIARHYDKEALLEGKQN